MFTPFLLTLMDEQRSDEYGEWFFRFAEAGITHVVLAHRYAYPGSPIAGRDFSPDRFTELVKSVLAAGFSPILMLSDVPHERDAVLNITNLLREQGLLPYCLLVPAWEPLPSEFWTSRQLYDLLNDMHAKCGDQAHFIGVHLQPGRASMASNPIEADDPWQGDEKKGWHDLSFVNIFLYQTDHGVAQFTGNPMGFEDRWRDVVPRFCRGLNGWRIMKVCFFEAVLYDTYRGALPPSAARPVATRAHDIAAEYGATVSFGNGLPF